MLTKRQTLILKAIIDAYSASGEPVGSKTLLGLTGIEASSATIRNEMVRLEKQGLIAKMHSSSGRVPTEAGYRYYINFIMPEYGGAIDSGLSTEDSRRLQEVFQVPYLALGEIVNRSTSLLAELTNYVAIALGPSAREFHLAGFRLVPIASHQVMAILVTEEGVVENQIFRLPVSIEEEDLEQMVRLINRELVGCDLTTVMTKLRTDFFHYLNESVQQLIGQGSMMEYLLNKVNTQRVYVQGKNNLYHYLYESDDIDQIDYLNQLLSNPDQMNQMLTPSEQGIQVKIGRDLSIEGLDHLSVMTAQLEGPIAHQTISVAILGPENMSYLRMAQLFQGVRVELCHYIDSYYHCEEGKMNGKNR